VKEVVSEIHCSTIRIVFSICAIGESYFTHRQDMYPCSMCKIIKPILCLVCVCNAVDSIAHSITSLAKFVASRYKGVWSVARDGDHRHTTEPQILGPEYIHLKRLRLLLSLYPDKEYCKMNLLTRNSSIMKGGLNQRCMFISKNMPNAAKFAVVGRGGLTLPSALSRRFYRVPPEKMELYKQLKRKQVVHTSIFLVVGLIIVTST
jgi:hypothetical protein